MAKVSLWGNFFLQKFLMKNLKFFFVYFFLPWAVKVHKFLTKIFFIESSTQQPQQNSREIKILDVLMVERSFACFCDFLFQTKNSINLKHVISFVSHSSRNRKQKSISWSSSRSIICRFHQSCSARQQQAAWLQSTDKKPAESGRRKVILVINNLGTFFIGLFRWFNQLKLR